MRYTPFLESHGIKMKDDVPDQLASVIDSALKYIEHSIDWGSYEGKKRKPCHEQPVLWAGMPIGMYHCPMCGMMLIAGMPHLSPQKHEPRCTCDGGWLARHEPNCETNYPDMDYEDEYGRPWPAGYEEDDAVGPD